MIYKVSKKLLNFETPDKMKAVQFLKAFLLVVMLFGFSVSASADSVDRLYAKAAEKYHELNRDTPFRKQADNWLKTIKQFQWIVQTYPKHPQAPKSLFNIGNLYRSLYGWNHKEVYLDRSSISFRTLVRDYPFSPLADNAQLLLGENYELYKLDDDLAAEEYKKVVERYPNTKSGEIARERLKRYQVGQKTVEIEPNLEKAASPEDLTIAQFGGISEADSLKGEAVLVSKVDYWSTADWSRMVINVRGGVRYKYQVLREDSQHKHKRLYVDIQNSFIPPRFNRRVATNDGLISQARIAQYDKRTVRVVLDMESLDKIKVFHFSLPNQYKIVIDIIGNTPDSPLIVENKPNLTGVKEKVLDSVSLSKILGLKVKTIILDPGHGGKDPGASAFNVMEKDIALRIAISLKRLINKYDPNIKVFMTRSTDVYVELEARTAFANKYRGDLFLSIHINASPRINLGGVETYYLNFTTDDASLNLAAKENQTSLKSISDLQTILNDLMVNSKIKESRDLAEKVQTSLIKETEQSEHKMRDLGVKRAPFSVLIGAQMPSILIEAGFLSNQTENGFLNTVQYRKTIAEGIFKGIKSYLD